MIPDKKKAAMLIIAGGAPKEGPAEYDIDDELEMIADDLMTGIAEKSHSKVVSALKAFHACIKAGDIEQDKEME